MEAVPGGAYIGIGDWREETDDEFRARIKAAIGIGPTEKKQPPPREG